MIKKAAIFCGVVGVSLALWFVAVFYQNNRTQEQKHLKYEIPSYYFLVSILGFDDSNAPLINVEINHETVTSSLDLGFRGELCFSSSLLAAIPLKQFRCTESFCGLRGIPYQKSSYLIPSVKIGKITFHTPAVEEENQQFLDDAVLWGKKTLATEVPPRIGWRLFQNLNLLLDFPQMKLGFCDSASTLFKEGYLTDTWIKTPLLLDRGLIEFVATTLQGPLRCVLDTGTTVNILRKNSSVIPADQPLNVDEKSTLPLFKVGDQEFGPITTHVLSIGLPMQVDLIVGMEFLRDRCVFIDFSEKLLYFSPKSPPKLLITK